MQKQSLLKDYHKLVSDRTMVDTLKLLQIEYTNRSVFPEKDKVFKSFQLCPYNDLKVVIIGQDPYPQKGYATGLAFANSANTTMLSPSLQMIMLRLFKDFPDYNCISDLPFQDVYGEPFDITLESWAKQGVLLLNSSLTVEENKVGSHSNLWYPFMKELITNLSQINSGIIYILFGKEASLFKSFINSKSNYILEYNHPAYYARNNKEFECNGFLEANNILFNNHNFKIKWN